MLAMPWCAGHWWCHDSDTLKIKKQQAVTSNHFETGLDDEDGTHELRGVSACSAVIRPSLQKNISAL